MKEYFSTAEAAVYLKVYRVKIFRWIKSGKLKAIKIGRSFAIPESEVKRLEVMLMGQKKGLIGQQEKEEQIQRAVRRVVKEYGKTLKKLGSE